MHAHFCVCMQLCNCPDQLVEAELAAAEFTCCACPHAVAQHDSLRPKDRQHAAAGHHACRRLWAVCSAMGAPVDVVYTVVHFEPVNASRLAFTGSCRATISLTFASTCIPPPSTTVASAGQQATNHGIMQRLKKMRISIIKVLRCMPVCCCCCCLYASSLITETDVIKRLQPNKHCCCRQLRPAIGFNKHMLKHSSEMHDESHCRQRLQVSCWALSLARLDCL